MDRATKQKALRWAEVKYRLRLLLPSLLLVALLVGLTILVMIIWPQMAFRDTKGKVLQHGTGVISSITYGVADQFGRTGPDEVLIAMGNPSVTYYYPNSFERLRKGQCVQVSYRVGKSGSIYVEEIKPEQEAKP